MPISQRQMEYLALAWQCFETEPKMDYEKFKTVAGLASANSAREIMRITKNKLRTEYGALSGGVKADNGIGGTPVRKNGGVGGGIVGTLTPKKRAATAGGDARSPRRAGMGKKRKAAVSVPLEESEGRESEVASPTPKKSAEKRTVGADCEVQAKNPVKIEPGTAQEQQEDEDWFH